MSILRNYDNTGLNKLKFKNEDRPYVVRKAEETYDVRKDDVVRVGEAIKNNPKFVSNQALLRTLDPNNITGKKGKGRSLLQATTAVSTTVTQTAVAGTGTRLVQESFFTDYYLDKLGAKSAKNSKIVSDSSKRPVNENLEEKELNILESTGLRQNKSFVGKFKVDKKVNDDESKKVIVGGENDYRNNKEESTKDSINFSRFENKPLYDEKEGRLPGANSTFTPKYTGIFLEKENKKKKVVPLKVKYSLENRLQTVGLYSNDIINKSDVYDNIEDVGSFQLIPFRFTIYPDTNPEYLYFRAYLDTFSDSFGSTWNGTQYVGRAEEFYNYQSFTRDINFDFKVAAESKDELVPLYKKLNRLVGSTSPSYSTGGTFMRGVFSRITIGDYLQNIPGFFKSVNLTWNTNYPWEVGIGQDSFPDDEVLRNPHVLNVSVNYTPVHTFNPEYGQNYLGVERNA